MRVLLCGLFCLAGCGLPGTHEPVFALAPALGYYKIGGSAKLASDAPAAPPSERIDARGFGLDRHDEAVGGTLSAGDGFSGFELSYWKFDHQTTRHGTLTQDFGVLRDGNQVSSNLEMDEWRLGYMGQLVELTPAEHWQVRAGVGAMLAHRDLDLDVRDLGTDRRQLLSIQDRGIAQATARVRVSYQRASLEGNYAICPELQFGGRFEGIMQEFDLRASWHFVEQDLRLFAGYRATELPARGFEQGRPFAADFHIEGFFIGGQFQF